MYGNTHVCISAGILDERVPLLSVLGENVVQWNQCGRNNWKSKTTGEIDLWSLLCKSINRSLIDRIRLALRDRLGYEYTSMWQKAHLLWLGLLISCWKSMKIISDIKTSQRNCVNLRAIRISVVCPNITFYCSLNSSCFADMILSLYYSRIQYTKLAPRGS